MAKTLTVVLAADVGKFRRDMQQAEGGLSGFAGSLKNVLGPALIGATAAAGAFAAKFAVDSIQAASDFNETLSKSSVIFGEASKSVQEFGENAVKSMGQTSDQAISAASQFGTFGKAAGLSGEQLAEFSTELVALASDLASFNNTEVDTAINAIGAGLRGEAEPLRALGVLLDDATLKAKALSIGIYDGNGSLTQQQKVLAAHKVILEQTTDAQGDFQRTQDGLANTTKTVTAAVEEAKIEIGVGLLKAVDSVSKAFGGANGFADIIEDSSKSIADMTYGVGVLAEELLDLRDATDENEQANKGWWQSLNDLAKEQTANKNLLGVLALTLEALGTQARITDEQTQNLNLAWSDYRRSQQGVVKVTPAVVDALNDTANAAKGAALSGAAAAKALLETSIATGQVPSAAQWAQRFDIAEMLSNIGELDKKTGALGKTADEKTVPAMDRMTKSIKDQLSALTDQVGRIDDAAKALDGYARSIQQGVLGGIDLGSVFNPQDAASTIDAYTKQISDVTAFSTSLANLGAQLPNTPGAQLLLSQILGEGYKGGQAFIDGLTTETATNLVGELDKAITAVEGNSYLLANKFYGEGVEAAQQTLDGMIQQILKDEKKLRKIGQSIGKPIGANIKAEIAASVAEAVAAAQAAGEAARAEAGAREASRQATLTEQQIAADLARLIRNSDSRSGRNVTPVLS